ncbi:hypothetical protein VPH35_064465 [Triticum aestivum]
MLCAFARRSESSPVKWGRIFLKKKKVKGTVDPWSVGTGSGGRALQKKVVAASGGGAPADGGSRPVEGAAVWGLSREIMHQKKATVPSGGSAQDSEESAAKHRTKKARTVSSGETSMVEADTSLGGDMAHGHPAEEADTPKDFQKPDSDETAHAKEESEEVKEAELLIQNLNDLGTGEHVSDDDFNAYFDQLPSMPRIYPDAVKLTSQELDKQVVHHALCRFRSYRHKVKEEGKDDTLGLKDVSEDECDRQFHKKWGYFKQIEENWTLDWYFHPVYCKDPSLSDYQRLVLRNYGGTEYARWCDYHEFLCSHVIEEEYANYCEELFKRLQWMEGYLDARRPSYKWDCISSRGAFQAMKIAATTFPKISASLAYYGYHECIASMGYDSFWFKELDGVYFEIWRRVTQRMMSFREALEEVYNLDRFPLRQHRMKVALEDGYIMGRMKSEYCACTAAITPEVKEDGAKALIAEGIRKQINKPKYYVEYIRKKIHIARVIGILPPHEGLKQQCNQDSGE